MVKDKKILRNGKIGIKMDMCSYRALITHYTYLIFTPIIFYAALF